jgi:hypothetical protein
MLRIAGAIDLFCFAAHCSPRLSCDAASITAIGVLMLMRKRLHSSDEECSTRPDAISESESHISRTRGRSPARRRTSLSITSIAISAQLLQMRIGWRLKLASIFASSGPVCCSVLLQNEQCNGLAMQLSIPVFDSSVRNSKRQVSTIGPRRSHNSLGSGAMA